MDLDAPQTQDSLLPEADNSVNQVEQEMYLKTVETPEVAESPSETFFWSEPEPTSTPNMVEQSSIVEEESFEQPAKEEEPVFEFRYPEPKEEKTTFTTLNLFSEENDSQEEEIKSEWLDQDEEEEDGLFAEDDQSGLGTETADDQVDQDELALNVDQTKKRLEAQARMRREQFEGAKKNEMSREEFNSKWSTPAYLRRGVKMENVPHSSQPHISKYNLNDDNNILGNNRFLHDNVD
jgi:cell division protein FtsZ